MQTKEAFYLHEEPPAQQENKEYTVENILAFRWCPKEGREYYVQWKDYSGSWDTWQKENTIKHTEAFARFTLHTPQMINGVSHFRSESEWKKAIKKKEPNPGDEDGSPFLCTVYPYPAVPPLVPHSLVCR